MRPLLALSLGGGLAGLASARQAANFNISAAEADAHGCGDTCQRILGLTSPADLDTVGADFDFDFYATAGNFSGSRPGDVLKLRPVNATARAFRAGTTAYRFQYTTVDLDGEPVPATGFIAFPYTAGMASFGSGSRNSSSGGAPDGRFPLAAFAHGTIGLFRGCAPSNGPSMFDYDSWQPLVARGYAVVATDYAGLGSNHTTHKYCSFGAHAGDVYYAVVAARKLFGGALSREWVSVGHSQGGGAAWKLAESPLVRNDTAYLGTVALSPATHVVDMLLDNAVTFPGYLPYLPLAVQRANPGYTETMLGEALRRRVAMAQAAQLCTNALMGLTFDLGREDLVSPAGVERDAPYLRDWQAAQAPALGARSPAPILVVQGLNDTSVLAATTQRAYERSCASGSEVHLSLYPGLEHSALPPAAEAEWLGWIDWRFAGGRYESRGCSKETKRPFDAEHVKAPPEIPLPDFLKGAQLQVGRRGRTDKV